MKRRFSSPAPQPELNLTNLMDVVFALLIVFMIAAPLMTQGIKADLPKAQSTEIEEPKVVTVSFDGDRRIFIDAQEVPLSDFTNVFAMVWGGNKETAVLIEGDRNVPYGDVVEVVDLIQKAGATKLGFLTQPGMSKARAAQAARRTTNGDR